MEPAITDRSLDGVLWSDLISAPHREVITAKFFMNPGPIHIINVAREIRESRNTLPVYRFRVFESLIGETIFLGALSIFKQVIEIVWIAPQAPNSAVTYTGIKA